MYQDFNDAILKGLIDAIFFLEFSEEDVVNPDNAVAILESIGSELQSMDEANKEKFKLQIKKIAPSYTENKKKFVLALPDYLGL